MKKLLAITLIVACVSSVTFAQSSGNESPGVESAVAPVFPPIAAAANVSGEVLVEVEVNEKGEVRAARSAGGHPLLRKASEDAASGWRFAPGVSGGKTRFARLTFAYRILRLRTPAAELAPMFVPPYRVEVRHEQLERIVHSDPPGYTLPPKRGRKRESQE